MLKKCNEIPACTGRLIKRAEEANEFKQNKRR
jgi:hypothetical protein